LKNASVWVQVQILSHPEPQRELNLLTCYPSYKSDVIEKLQRCADDVWDLEEETHQIRIALGTKTEAGHL